LASWWRSALTAVAIAVLRAVTTGTIALGQRIAATIAPLIARRLTSAVSTKRTKAMGSLDVSF
jgi:hypothetical protein